MTNEAAILIKSGGLQIPFTFDNITFSDIEKVFFVKQNEKAGVILLK
jgi:hypothetical protein